MLAQGGCPLALSRPPEFCTIGAHQLDDCVPGDINYFPSYRCVECAPTFFSAPRSVRRPLLTPQVNPGSLYRCGKSDYEQH